MYKDRLVIFRGNGPSARVCHPVKLEMVVRAVIILVEQPYSRLQEDTACLRVLISALGKLLRSPAYGIMFIGIIGIEPLISQHITIHHNPAEDA